MLARGSRRDTRAQRAHASPSPTPHHDEQHRTARPEVAAAPSVAPWADQRSSLFDSWSNHIPNRVNCVPEIRSSATSTIVAVVISLSKKMREHGDDEPEREPEHRHQGAEHVEEDERVEVADHVLLLHPPPEALEEEPRDPRRDAADLDPRPLADAVDRSRRHVAHARARRRSGARACRSGTRSGGRSARGRGGRAPRARAPCSRPASRRRASSPRRSSSGARAPRCRGSGCAGSASTPRP